MKRVIFVISILLLVGILSACQTSESKDEFLTGDKPPDVSLEIGGGTYETELGSYCWSRPLTSGEVETKCIDVDLHGEDETPVEVKTGEQIKLTMDYAPKPNEVRLSQIDNYNESTIEVIDNQIVAPDKAGTYFYIYSVNWMDMEGENVSRGGADYGFVLKVN